MMNKSLRAAGQESSDKDFYGFRAARRKHAARADLRQICGGKAQSKKEPPDNGGFRS
jgi:hypothetical protein